jgi:hypothetical protein
MFRLIYNGHLQASVLGQHLTSPTYKIWQTPYVHSTINYKGNSISKLQIVIEKNWMEIMTYKQHLFFNIISIQI